MTGWPGRAGDIIKSDLRSSAQSESTWHIWEHPEALVGISELRGMVCDQAFLGAGLPLGPL